MLDKIKLYKYNVNDLELDFVSVINDPIDKFIYQSLEILLTIEKGHAYYLSDHDDEGVAAAIFEMQILNSGKQKYLPLIKAYERDIDELLSLNTTIKKVGTTLDNITFTDAAAEDTSLRKENITPDMINKDLTSDHFISGSERFDVNTGERIRDQVGSHSLDEELITRDNAAILLQLRNIQSNITNLYKEWVDYIDKLYLVI